MHERVLWSIFKPRLMHANAKALLYSGWCPAKQKWFHSITASSSLTNNANGVIVTYFASRLKFLILCSLSDFTCVPFLFLVVSFWNTIYIWHFTSPKRLTEDAPASGGLRPQTPERFLLDMLSKKSSKKDWLLLGILCSGIANLKVSKVSCISLLYLVCHKLNYGE